MEDLPVDDGGKVAALSLGEYKLPTSMDMPPLRTVLLHTQIGPGPFGAKAVGEVTNSGVAPGHRQRGARCGRRARDGTADHRGARARRLERRHRR